MALAAYVFIVLTALKFFFIFYLETLVTDSDKTSATFGMDKRELQRESVQKLFKNQGVYNLLIGILLLVSTFVLHSHITVALLLIYIIGVAAYGGYSSGIQIFFKQSPLAILALIFMMAAGLL